MNKPVIRHTIPPEDEVAFRAGVRRGIADADAGRTVPFQPVATWLASWGSGNELSTKSQLEIDYCGFDEISPLPCVKQLPL